MARSLVGILPLILVAAGSSLLGQQLTSTSGARAGKATVEGIQLEYATRGTGEPVVFVHAGCFADWFTPLIEERALTDRYRVITYHRIGYEGSTHVSGAVTLVQQAAQLRALLRHLGIARAHIVGHSSGGNIALQLALDAFVQAIADADTFFGQELPAVQQWRFTRVEAKRISQPVLAVTGEKSSTVSPIWSRRQALLLEWLPNVQGFVLPGATHLLHVQNPRGMADRLVVFFAHHGLAKK